MGSRTRRAITPVVALVVLAGCSNGTPTAQGSPSEAGSATGSTTTSASPGASPLEAGPVHYYECASLLSDQEVQAATGMADAAFLSEEQGEAVEGQTYCQFFAGQGAISIAVSVDTGPAFLVYQQLEAAGAALPDVPGLGDAAKWSEQGGTLGVRVGNVGLTIAFTNLGGGALGIADAQGAAVDMATLILSRL